PVYDNQSVQQQSEYDTVRQFTPLKHHKTLANYVEQMALDLVDTLEAEAPDNNSINIAVTTIVDLDASLNKSNQLGNQLAETFIHQLQKFGYGVVDFKTMDNIDVSNRGDFVLSRDIEKLSESSMANYVLAGTLIYRPNGVAVNTRVINVHSKHIVASSRKLIPLYVLNKEDIYLSSN
ncbi:FlgO family outer membrane protein, partial [uncultured Pseudoalteromonas sp.]|uniref:FlgO family outer membrane protein n=1 Tax=uncultured Pseudoalteromonas sp. TaxID=114053 RepID=UPI0025916C10